MRSRAGKVLILSPHVMTAALVGWYVELAKLEPAFVAPGEHPQEALARVKPVLVVLIDAEFEEALSDLLVARASRRGIGIALFGTGSQLTEETTRAWAAEHGIRFFRLPVELETFARVLDLAMRDGHVDRRTTPDRRAGPALDRAIDGTLMLIDQAGRTWYVYDRRAADRRNHSEVNASYRTFISADGDERRCALDDAEFSAREPSVLASQLDRAAAVR